MNHVRGNRNPQNSEIRWFLGTAIKGRLRAAPYPDTHRQKDAAPKKAMEGLPEKKEKHMNYMDFQPHLIRERNEHRCKGRSLRCGSRSGCERLADRVVRGSLPSPSGA